MHPLKKFHGNFSKDHSFNQVYMEDKTTRFVISVFFTIFSTDFYMFERKDINQFKQWRVVRISAAVQCFKPAVSMSVTWIVFLIGYLTNTTPRETSSSKRLLSSPHHMNSHTSFLKKYWCKKNYKFLQELFIYFEGKHINQFKQWLVVHIFAAIQSFKLAVSILVLLLMIVHRFWIPYFTLLLLKYFYLGKTFHIRMLQMTYGGTTCFPWLSTGLYVSASSSMWNGRISGKCSYTTLPQ